MEFRLKHGSSQAALTTVKYMASSRTQTLVRITIINNKQIVSKKCLTRLFAISITAQVHYEKD